MGRVDYLAMKTDQLWPRDSSGMLLGLVGLVPVLLFSNGLPPVLPCIYAGIQFLISFFMRIPACHSLTNQCDRWSLVRFVKWMRQERYYVGRGMFERTTDFIKSSRWWNQPGL